MMECVECGFAGFALIAVGIIVTLLLTYWIIEGNIAFIDRGPHTYIQVGAYKRSLRLKGGQLYGGINSNTKIAYTHERKPDGVLTREWKRVK